ncbi:MAG: divalent-cation tolerance protein CutA [Elusimicrobia bacterium]|nr:divalent-cation tolerance protein CutA [Elusimicrobiota bacterium]
MTPYSVVLVTVPDEKTADRIAQDLLEKRLAACVNRVPGLLSRYRWEGKIENDAELLLIIKTRSALFGELAQAVKALHPYTVPEIVALPISEGYAQYLAWLGANTLFAAPEPPSGR